MDIFHRDIYAPAASEIETPQPNPLFFGVSLPEIHLLYANVQFVSVFSVFGQIQQTALGTG